MTDPNSLVRVRGGSGEYTVRAGTAKRRKLAVLDKPAVDVNGRPLAPKPLIKTQAKPTPPAAGVEGEKK